MFNRVAGAGLLAVTVAMAWGGSALALPSLTLIGSYSAGSFGTSAAEIAAYDPATQRVFVVNGATQQIDILDISNPYSPQKVGALSPKVDATGLAGANSVAVKNGIVAVAVEAAVKQDPGKVAFYSTGGSFLGAVPVGALPDMLTFTPDGTRVLVANEGEPNSYNQPTSVDPVGSVSIIDISGGANAAAPVTTAGFTAFNGQEAALRAQGVRIYGPNASAAQDFEPEYIAVSADSTTAWVTLQENNALAKIDIATGAVTAIKPLGFKDHSLPGNGLDGSDRDGPGNDGKINIQNWPLKGMYLPDAIASFTYNGQTYLVTANEGDAREYTGFAEEARVSALTLDPAVFTNAATLQSGDGIGRLNVTTTLGANGPGGSYQELYSLGGRSFSIWDADGNLVWDSGDQFEQIIAAQFPDVFNSDNADQTSFDTRSDNKGPEPEAITVAEIGGRLFAFIGLERQGGVMIYDITDPFNPYFVAYHTDRDFDVTEALAGQLGPEGLLFISADDSPIGQALLIAANEVSGTTDILLVNVAEPGTIATFAAGLLALGAWRRRRQQ
ncbi:MAG: choice-of-anchor I family protein [Rhodospirillales bacterium]